MAAEARGGEARNWGGTTLVVPALVLVAAFLLAPLALILRYSFDKYDPVKLMLGVFQIGNYVQVVADPYYRKVLMKTAEISGLSTVIVMLLAFPVAYYIS